MCCALTSFTFREVSLYAAAAGAPHTFRAEPAGCKVAFTVFSAPPHSRLIREIPVRFRARAVPRAPSFERYASRSHFQRPEWVEREGGGGE